MEDIFKVFEAVAWVFENIFVVFIKSNMKILLKMCNIHHRMTLTPTQIILLQCGLMCFELAN